MVKRNAPRSVPSVSRTFSSAAARVQPSERESRAA
jgi:hypothetical protein